MRILGIFWINESYEVHITLSQLLYGTVLVVTFILLTWVSIDEKQPNVQLKPSLSVLVLVYHRISRLASDSVRDLGGDDMAFV
jgi:hypothetical protein